MVALIQLSAKVETFSTQIGKILEDDSSGLKNNANQNSEVFTSVSRLSCIIHGLRFSYCRLLPDISRHKYLINLGIFSFFVTVNVERNRYQMARLEVGVEIQEDR